MYIPLRAQPRRCTWGKGGRGAERRERCGRDGEVRNGPHDLTVMCLCAVMLCVCVVIATFVLICMYTHTHTHTHTHTRTHAHTHAHAHMNIPQT